MGQSGERQTVLESLRRYHHSLFFGDNCREESFLDCISRH